VPALQNFKFTWFGHDAIILHEKEIRKQIPPFQFLTNQEKRATFMDGLSGIIEAAPMTIVAAVIKKDTLRRRYIYPDNPYHISLMFCLERLYSFLVDRGQQNLATHIVCEQRGGKDLGGKEDKELELEFLRIKDGRHYLNRQKMPHLDLKIISKKTNSTGLQIADLIARPIGLHVVRPAQANRAYDLIAPKIRSCKVFP
jgi:hypothetical protein